MLIIVSGMCLKLLTAEEVELLICGKSDPLYDLSVLRANARYEGGFSDDSETVEMFWRCVTPAASERQRVERHEVQTANVLGTSSVDEITREEFDRDETSATSTAANSADAVSVGGSESDKSSTATGASNDDNNDDDDDDDEYRLTRDERRRLLAFVSGSDRIPPAGLESMRWTLQKNGSDANRLIASSTCFNICLLPDYRDRKTLFRNLKFAVDHSQGFGMQ